MPVDRPSGAAFGAGLDEAPSRARATLDASNRYPQWGPICRIWHLLDEADVALGAIAGSTRAAWVTCVALDLARDRGFEPVIGWRNAAGICRVSEKSLWLADHRLPGDAKVPAYRGPTRGGRSPTVVFPLCQLVRWAEARLGWARRPGW